MTFRLWIDCSVIVMFAIQLLHASIGQSLHQHTAMLQRMLEIGSTKGILGNSYQRFLNEEFLDSHTVSQLMLYGRER